jgi:hypothetical protein
VVEVEQLHQPERIGPLGTCHPSPGSIQNQEVQ